MSLLTVVQDVCAVTGVMAPTSVFANIDANRTMFEMVACANEMAQNIAGDERDWTGLTTSYLISGTGTAKSFPLPANYKRLLLSSNIWRSTSTQQPMRFIANADDWLKRRNANETDAWGEWTLLNGEIFIWPILTADEFVTFAYLDKNCIALASGGFGDRFMQDTDTFRLPERLLKLAMIWKWKSQKGGQYAEDMSTYYDALTRVAGSDKPAPILIDRSPISHHARVSGSWPAGWGPP